MLIYNTLTKRKEEFIPISANVIKMYVCGPTVYGYFHIGNARTFIMADMIRRYLEYKGYNVEYIMNLTDIDDKIINKANDEKKDSTEIAAAYSKAFFEDIERLKIKKATHYPRATQNINEIIGMIKRLEDKGFAYNVDGDVFYDVRKFSEYGKLSGKKLDELEVGSRIAVNEIKRDPLDFSLWKKAKEEEPSWDSPWGKGRPGWHIECSAMSCKFLGETFDIHAGANDLIFPHHENEIAQSEAANGKKFVNYWLHFGFLNFNNEKMSKSLGNFFTARDILKQYSTESIRLLFAQTHYAGPLNFSEDLLSAASKGVDKLINASLVLEEKINSNNSGENPGNLNFEEYENRFQKAMDDDFNTPQAVAVIFDFVKDFNTNISEKSDLNKEFFKTAKNFLKKTAQNVLGILDFNRLSTESNGSLEKDLIELLIEIRVNAKKDKNYNLADTIRDKLNELGVTLQDSKEKTTYKIASR
jgi:cysteinyl-tRNA synthetase